MRPILYTAGPYSSPDGDHGIRNNIRTASAIALEGWRAGWAVFCPHKNTRDFHLETDIPWETWIDGDLSILRRCDALLLLPGWWASPGALIEKRCATENGIPVYYYETEGMPRPVLRRAIKEPEVMEEALVSVRTPGYFFRGET